MPDAPVTPGTAPAAQPVSQAPPDAPATKNGAPLTAASSLEDLLSADQPPPTVTPVVNIPEGTGQSPTEAAQAAPDEPAQSEPPPETPTPSEEPTEPSEEPEPAPSVNEDDLVQQLTEQKIGLLREQGKKNKELGDLRARVRELEERDAARATAPQAQIPSQISPEDLAARILENPGQAIPALVEPLVVARATEIVKQIMTDSAREWQEQQVYEQAAVAPEVGKDLFLQRHGIKQDFETWIATPEGSAVNALFEKDESRADLLTYYKATGNPTGIANTLTKALEAHRIGKKAAQGRQTIASEKARIQAAHPPSAPPRPAAPSPASVTPPQEKSIFDPTMTEAELRQWMQTAQPYEHE